MLALRRNQVCFIPVSSLITAVILQPANTLSFINDRTTINCISDWIVRGFVCWSIRCQVSRLVFCWPNVIRLWFSFIVLSSSFCRMIDEQLWMLMPWFLGERLLSRYASTLTVHFCVSPYCLCSYRWMLCFLVPYLIAAPQSWTLCLRALIWLSHRPP